jgi:hypothetical protein
MRARHRTNFLLGLIALVIAVVALAQALGVLPAPVYDLIVRAWPAALVMLGLGFLLRGRARFSGVIAFVVSVALAVGLGAYAFSSRAAQQRDDQSVAISQPTRADLSLLRIRVSTLSTDVELLRALDDSAGISGKFTGSSESRVTSNYDEAADGSATFTVSETRSNLLPMLASLGRGTLRLEIPSNVPVDIEFQGTDGTLAMNVSSTRVERLNVDLARGNAVVTLPDYQPLFSKNSDTLGTLAARDGDLTIAVPSTIAARLTLDRGGSGIDPDYDPGVYNFLFNSVLEARGIETATTIVQYNVVAQHGRIRLIVAPASAPVEALPTAAVTASP